MNTTFMEHIKCLDSEIPGDTEVLKCFHFQYMEDLGNWFAFQIKVPTKQSQNEYVMYLEVYGLKPSRSYVRTGGSSYPKLDDEIVVTTVIEPVSGAGDHEQNKHSYQMKLNIDPGHKDSEWIFFLRNEPQQQTPKVKHRYVFVKSNKTVAGIPV